MKLMPDILSTNKTEQSAIFEIFIPNDLAHFSGHFPGLPILPGVVQLDWAIKLMHESFGIQEDRFVGIKAMKFMAPLVPDTHATLSLEIRPESGRMLFIIHSRGKTCTSGQVLLSTIKQQ